MAPQETGQSNSAEQQQNGSTEATSGQEQQGQQPQATTGAPPEGTGQQQPQQPAKHEPLPDDHPAAKALEARKAEISDLKRELAEARTQSAKTTQLQEELDKRPTQEALDTLQSRYDRLEAFLQAAGGDISKALDSRSFTRDLFESDKDIATLVKEWNKAHPSTTSTALGAAAAQQQGSKPSQNDLLRAAIGS